MMNPGIRVAVLLLLFCGPAVFLQAQAKTLPDIEARKAADSKPYKILTSGKKITIQSKQNLNSVIVWTSGGHRMIEQKKINADSYSFTITIKEKIFFVMVEMEDGKRYTSKIGVN